MIVELVENKVQAAPAEHLVWMELMEPREKLVPQVSKVNKDRQEILVNVVQVAKMDEMAWRELVVHLVIQERSVFKGLKELQGTQVTVVKLV